MVGEKKRKKSGINTMAGNDFRFCVPKHNSARGLNINLPWLRWAKIGVLLVLFMISVFNKKLFPLRQYFGVFWRFL